MTVESCLFCKIGKQENPSELLYEDDEIFAINDIAPQAPIHQLIIPKFHIATVNDLTDQNADIVGKMFLCAKTLAAKAGLSEDGYRLIMNCNAHGGQTVFHIHLHLLGGRQIRGFG